nr:MAG: replication associated protein [Cressdnaviricota sp.]
MPIDEAWLQGPPDLKRSIAEISGSETDDEAAGQIPKCHTGICRAWNFTLNNYDPTCAGSPPDFFKEGDYACYAQEVAPKTGTPHLQGFLWAKDRVSPLALKKRSDTESTWNKSWFTRVNFPLKAISYCEGLTQKKGFVLNPTFVEWGERPKQDRENDGDETDYQSARANAAAGRFEDIPDKLYTKNFFAYHGMHKFAKRTMYPQPSLTELPQRMGSGHWVWGPSGTGKSWMCRHREGGVYEVNIPNGDSKLWISDYKGERALLFDDLGLSQARRWGEEFKQMCDIVPKKWNVSVGKQMDWRPDVIMVTSNYSMEQMFPDPAVLGPLKKRFIQQHLTEVMEED